MNRIARIGGTPTALDRVVCAVAVRLTAQANEESFMLESIAVILVLLWLAGMVSAYTLGGFIHILLVLAVIVIAVRLIRGRPVA